MRLIKRFFYTFTINVLILISSSCTFNPLDSQYTDHTTMIRYTPVAFLNRYTKFHVFHTSGTKLNSCLNTLDTLSIAHSEVTIYSPCIYSNRFQDIWSSEKKPLPTLKNLVENNLNKTLKFFDSFGLNKTTKFDIQIVLTPKNHTYHFQKTFWQFGEIKIFIGLEINLEDWNNQELVHNLINTTVHEFTHVFDNILNRAENKLEMEKIAHLAAYCASTNLGLYKSKKLPVSNMLIDSEIFEKLNGRSISDEMIEKNIVLDAIDDNVEKWIKPDKDQLAIFIVQKNLYEVLGNYNDDNLNAQELEKIMAYCNYTISKHFSKTP